MEPRLVTIPQKLLIGKSLQMTFAHNRTAALWQSFMPYLKEIKNTVGTDLFSMQIYGPSFDFVHFDLHAPFEKWAAVEVSEHSFIPAGMKPFILAGGLYAVFMHYGPASEGERTFRYIFETWIPASAYQPDQRPHFEVLGPGYKNNDPGSEEEIWIPVKANEIQ